MIYYHYLSAINALEDLEKDRIKVSTLDSLNDPFEFMPYRRYGHKERQPYNKVFRDVSKKWGILCFSHIWTEQLLWAHYADKHRGVALGFEIPNNNILKVDYASDEIRTKFDLSKDNKENECRFLDLAKIKFREWKYEKEYRLLLELDRCVKDGSLYFHPFNEDLKIKEVVLGCRFDHKTNRNKVKELATKIGVQVIATREGWEDYRIHECGTKTPWYT